MGIKLAPPPSIKERILAAIEDQHHFHIVYYNRKEGATTAILDIAKGRKDIFVTSNVDLRSMYDDVQWFDYQRSLRTPLNDKIVIADCISDHALKEMISRLRLFYNVKVVAIKPLR